MPNKQVTLIAKITAKPGKEDQVKKELLAVIDPTRSEAGCISYNLHQDADNNAVFMFYENWSSKEILEQHLQTPHLQGLLAKADELFAEPLEVKFYEILA
ncbi:MAG: putative quinol monooxygenase [Geobacteraceae bacterium]|nr:putative quinol monooxygenase [Geobacteraceae bacterium]